MPAMLPFEFTIPTFSNGQIGTETTRAMETENSLILITEATEMSGMYRLTHRPTGMAITGSKFAATADVFGLFELAADLGRIGDWGRTGIELHRDKAFSDMVKSLVRLAPIKWQSFEANPDHAAASKAALMAGKA